MIKPELIFSIVFQKRGPCNWQSSNLSPSPPQNIHTLISQTKSLILRISREGDFFSRLSGGSNAMTVFIRGR